VLIATPGRLHEHLDAIETRVWRLEMIEQSAGRGDEHLDAPPERGFLRTHRDAPVDRRAADAREAREPATVLVDLRGQLARGREHERARRARTADRALKNRQQERGGLAAAGHRAGED